MTLILYMANRDFAVQISDRRLTSSRGLETDESGKAAILTTSDARFSVGFTGLAGWGSYETQFAIIDHLSKLGKLGVHSSRPLALRLAEWMSQDFRRLAASREDKRTSILWLGYRYVGRETPDPRISVGLISNFEDLSGRRLDLATDDFQVDLQSEPVGDGTATATMTYATAIGTTGGLLDDDLGSLRRLLFRRPTSRSVENLGARAVRRAAQASRSGGLPVSS